MSENVVEPLVIDKAKKRKPYHPPSRHEILRRCILLSRELRNRSDSTGTGEVSLYNVSYLEGRKRGVDTASPAETCKATVSESRLGARKGCTIPRTSMGQKEKLEDGSRDWVPSTESLFPEGQEQEGTLTKRVCPNPPIAKSEKPFLVSSGGP